MSDLSSSRSAHQSVPDADDAPPIPSTLIDTLNEEQRAAVLHGRGPALILAGAGSGKTRVLTHRIAGLISVGIPSHQILALTFTNKAAREMRERVQSLVIGDDASVAQRVTLQTFHAFGASFLRTHAEELGRTSQFFIYDSDDRQKLIKEVLKAHKIELDRNGIADLIAAFDAAKYKGMGAEEAYCPPLDSRPNVDVKRLGWAYEEALKEANAFDFGDLIVKPLKLLQDPVRRAQMRGRFPWVLVDEFQDTNRAQLLLLQAISPPQGDLFVVGDDDQSIYAWRGAEVSNILGFESHFPSARTYKLQQNYRSKGNILNAANGVIRFNTDRLGKKLWTAQDLGGKIKVYHASNEHDEAHYIAQNIKKLVAQGRFNYDDIAILYRANSLTLNLERALMSTDFSIPYVIVRGRNFFERAIVKDALAHLRLLINPRDLIAYQRAIGSVSRGVGKTSLERIVELSSRLKIHLFEAGQEAIKRGLLKGKAKKGAQDFYRLYTEGPHLECDQLADQAEALLRAADLYHPERLNDLADEQRRAEIENISRLIDTISDFEERSDEPTWFSYLEQVSLIADADHSEGNGDGKGAVSLMTVHASKGLEFPVVFLVGLEEELFPSAMRGGEADLEEERRLFYVAVTRAEHILSLTYAQMRTWHGNRQPRLMSRFVHEIESELLQHVRHSPLRTWVQRNATSEGQVRPAKRPSVSNTRPVERSPKANRAQNEGVSRRVTSGHPSLPDRSRKSMTSEQASSHTTPKRATSPVSSRASSGSRGADAFREGGAVTHKTYGVGVINRLEQRGTRHVARVQFAEQERVILLSFLTPHVEDNS